MVASLPKPISSGSSKEEEKEGSHLSYLSGIELHIAQQRAGSFHNNESDGSVVHHYKKLNTHAFHTIRTAEEAKKETYDNEYDEEYDEDDDEEYDNIDKISQFNLNLLSLFGLILMLSHVWWIIDIILWSFKFYTTGLNGNWFGNPIQQCRL